MSLTKIEKQIEVDVPVRSAYNQWIHFEDFPLFMDGVQEVKLLEGKRLQWRMRHGDNVVELEAEILEQAPDRTIAWKSVNGSSQSVITFNPITEDRTEILFSMSYDEKQFPKDPESETHIEAARVEADLRRFKSLVEKRSHINNLVPETV